MRAVQYIHLVEGQYTYENSFDDDGNPIVLESPVFEVVGDNFEYYVASVYGLVDELSFEIETNTVKAVFVDSSNMFREVFFEFVQDTEQLEGDLEHVNDTPEYENPPEYDPTGEQPQKWVPEEESYTEEQPDSGDNEDPDVPEEIIPPDVPGNYPGPIIQDPPPTGPEVLPGDKTEESESDDKNTWEEEYLGDPEADPDYGYGDKSDGEPDVPDAPVNNLGTVWPITNTSDTKYYPETVVEYHNLVSDNLGWVPGSNIEIDGNQASVTNNATLKTNPIEYDLTKFYRFEFDVEFEEGVGTGTPSLIINVVALLDNGSTQKTVNLATWDRPGSLVAGNSYNVPWSIIKNLALPYEDFPVIPTVVSDRAGVINPNFGITSKRIYVSFTSNKVKTVIRGLKVYSNTGPLAP